ELPECEKLSSSGGACNDAVGDKNVANRERVMSGTDKSSTTRRELLQAAASAGAATTLLGGLGVNPAMAAEVGRSEKPLKAAFSNAGLQATWCAQASRRPNGGAS